MVIVSSVVLLTICAASSLISASPIAQYSPPCTTSSVLPTSTTISYSYPTSSVLPTSSSISYSYPATTTTSTTTSSNPQPTYSSGGDGSSFSHIVHYTCLAPGNVPFTDPSKGNTAAGINFISAIDQISPASKCNVVFAGQCAGNCQASLDHTQTFSCFLNGMPVIVNSAPATVNVWWGFDTNAGTSACNMWISSCNNQCNAE